MKEALARRRKSLRINELCMLPKFVSGTLGFSLYLQGLSIGRD
jgi:hypothetical protein